MVNEGGWWEESNAKKAPVGDLEAGGGEWSIANGQLAMVNGAGVNTGGRVQGWGRGEVIFARKSDLLLTREGFSAILSIRKVVS